MFCGILELDTACCAAVHSRDKRIRRNANLSGRQITVTGWQKLPVNPCLTLWS